jgi:hypothetical protein
MKPPARFARFLRLASLAISLTALAAAGCATAPPRGKAVPDELQSVANVIGFPRRDPLFPPGRGHVQEFESDFLDSNERERAWLRIEKGKPLPPNSYLAISGGGDNGAFGAGFLNGWSKSGKRPEFKLVTGVSTGALIAPFAFLGSAYDERLKSLYTGVSLQDIALKRSLLSVLYGDAVADTTPLWQLVKKYITREMVEAIAKEHEKGRVLLVATTNLDVRRSVIWNITEIAATRAEGRLETDPENPDRLGGHPGHVSSGDDRRRGRGTEIPGNARGRRHRVADLRLPGRDPAPRARRARQDSLRHPQRAPGPGMGRDGSPDPPDRARAITCLIQNQGVGDLYRIFAITQRDQVNFNLVYIPRSFQVPHTADFDTTYMKALFETGRLMAEEGQAWEKRPPVLITGGTRPVSIEGRVMALEITKTFHDVA